MRHAVRLLVAICFAVGGVQGGVAQTDKRLALIIGNSAYQHTRALPNPRNDAKAIAELLGNNGFQVTSLLDLDYEAMRKALRAFAEAARDADIALVHFGGHGLEVAGKNYLMPTDAKARRDTDLEYEAITLDSVMAAVGHARRLGLVILDACRNNPLGDKMQLGKDATRAVKRGLARVDPPHNVMVAYSAKEGTLALDGSGRHSPFAEALLKHMATPGLDVRQMFGKVRDDVLIATRNEQTPFTYASLGGDFVALVPGLPLTQAQKLELEFWNSVKDSTSSAVLRSYLERYGEKGEFALIARALIEHYDRREAAELAEREEAKRRREQEQREAAAKKLEEQRRAQEMAIAEERRKAAEAKKLDEIKRLDQELNTKWAEATLALQKAQAELREAEERTKTAEVQHLKAVKSAEQAKKAAQDAITAKREVEKTGDPTKLAALPKIETPTKTPTKSHPLDGTWTIVYQSTECRIKGGSYSMRIAAGTINKRGSSLSPSGAAQWMGGNPGVYYTGVLRGTRGSGTFANKVAGCNGTWTATRN